MDYINDVTVPRVASVIEGELGGVSVNQNWSGGGSFVYLELLKNNTSIIDLIYISKTKENLSKIWSELSSEQFISYKLNSHYFNSETSEFNTLSFNEMQLLLIDLLDKNYLYVNYSDIKDESHNVSKNDILLNDKFYNNG
jgi:adenine-specific DNA-methyltransferase